MGTLMKKYKFINIAKNTLQAEINSLKKLKSKFPNSFGKAVEAILDCKGKVVVTGVGKSGTIGAKISSTLASVGTPSFFIDANSCSHGNLGMVDNKDCIIIISLSGMSVELKDIIQYANRRKIKLIGIVSKRNSLLYKASDIKILLPDVVEADPNKIVPTSSTIVQLAIGDALAIATMKHKKFSKLDFKKFHPGGSLAIQLKTVEDLMLIGKKIPFINENTKMKKALKILEEKKLGVLIVVNKKKQTTGIITDGDIKRSIQKNVNLHMLIVKKIMTKKPICIDKNMLAAKALGIMNEKKITSLCVNNKKKTIGLLHIHNILASGIK
tara:strand:- start:117 stop:1094 length:978 start_codon:yes stop_codon:yes gene_type:complete